jgi:hypothetical protein
MNRTDAASGRPDIDGVTFNARRRVFRRPRRGMTQLGCLLTLLVMAAIAYFGTGALRIYWRSVEFKDALTREVRLRGKLPDREIARRIRVVADSMGLPEAAGDVAIRRKDGVITIESWYEESLALPAHRRDWPFNIRVSATY